jgi:RecG-like helicase
MTTDFHSQAEHLAIPERTLDQVQAFMAEAAKKRSTLSAARLLLRHGRMTTEAKAWLMRTYNQSE